VAVFIEGRSRTVGRGTAAAAGGGGFYIPLIPGHLVARRDGSYLWVSLRNSVVADTSDGPRFLLTHVEDIEERKRHELALAHRASHDQLTGLPNGAELRTRTAEWFAGNARALSAAESAHQIATEYERSASR